MPERRYPLNKDRLRYAVVEKATVTASGCDEIVLIAEFKKDCNAWLKATGQSRMVRDRRFRIEPFMARVDL